MDDVGCACVPATAKRRSLVVPLYVYLNVFNTKPFENPQILFPEVL